jgi:hypothetical protein
MAHHILTPSSSSTVAAAAAPLGNYADLYIRGSYDVMHLIRTRELDKVAVAAAEISTRLRTGGRIVSAIGTPHIMVSGACAADVQGNPNIAPDGPVSMGPPAQPLPGDAAADGLGEGDVLLVANPSDEVARAYARGCYVVGVGFPMTTNRYSPPGYNDFPDESIESMCNVFIYDWAPKEDGLVTPRLRPPHTPSTPMKILPTSPVTVVIYWVRSHILVANTRSRES